jgi:hypothetical protein
LSHADSLRGHPTARQLGKLAQARSPLKSPLDDGARLQQWYEPGTGLWKSTDWWNSVKALTVVIDYFSIPMRRISPMSSSKLPASSSPQLLE